MRAERPPRRRSPLLGGGALLVAVMLAVAATSPLLAPYPPDEYVDSPAARYRPPGTSLYELRLADGKVLLADAVEIESSRVRLLRLARWQELPRSAVRNLVDGEIADRRTFILGSDQLGRDLLSRVLHGARVSLPLALLAGGLAVLLGLGVGGIAGLAGGWLDGLLMRTADGMLCMPRLFLLLALAGLMELDTVLLIVALGATSWMEASRLVRGEVRGFKRRGFVAAARASGATPGRLLLRHLLPAALTPVSVDAALRVGELILIEAALSFLGLGVQPPRASWGSLIAEGSLKPGTAWWMAAFPGAALVLTVVGLNLLGDGLRDRLDPRRR